MRPRVAFVGWSLLAALGTWGCGLLLDSSDATFRSASGEDASVAAPTLPEAGVDGGQAPVREAAAAPDASDGGRLPGAGGLGSFSDAAPVSTAGTATAADADPDATDLPEASAAWGTDDSDEATPSGEDPPDASVGAGSGAPPQPEANPQPPEADASEAAVNPPGDGSSCTSNSEASCPTLPPRALATPELAHVFPPRCAVAEDCNADEQCRSGWCAPNGCGDGALQGAEQCDDGNALHSDGCELDCTFTRLLDFDVAESTSCVLLSSGGVKCWGQDSSGLLAQGTSARDSADPVTAPLLDFGKEQRVVQLSSGWEHLCVVFEDGSARCWGSNVTGQLGIGANDGTLAYYGDDPGEVLASLPDLPLTNVRQIAAGGEHTCALLGTDVADPEVICWGAAEPELGIGTLTAPVLSPAESRPVNLAGVTPAYLSASGSVTCVVLDTRQVLCWGNNATNGLGGTGSNWEPVIPDHVQSLGNGIDLVSGVGSPRCCAFGVPDDLFCWGNNEDAALGTPLLTDEYVRFPSRVELNGRRFVDLQVGDNYGCGLSEQGHVYCFGKAISSKLGYGGRYSAALSAADNWDALPNEGAVDLGDYDADGAIDPAARLFATRAVICAEMQDGSLRCWGGNSFAKLGYGFDGTTAPDATLLNFGDDETPAEAYQKVGRPDARYW